MVIRSDDKNAVVLLEQKIERLEKEQARMKAVNAYYKKEKTLDGCPDLTDEQRRGIEKMWAMGWYKDRPYPPYELTNNNANIRRLKGRITEIQNEELKRECADLRGDDGVVEGNGYTLVENREMNRIQFIFDGKPEEGIRNTLKMWGFKWAPSQGAWQRMLNGNGRYAAKMVRTALDAE